MRAGVRLPYEASPPWTPLMNSPFPASTARPGDGRIVVGLRPNGEPGLEVVAYQYPLKLIAPSTGAGVGGGAHKDSSRGGGARKKSALVFLLSYGGGLVAGDQVRLAVEVRAGARLSLVTQGTTKVFKARGPGHPVNSATAAFPPATTRQALTLRVAAGAALCLLPDPVQPFADSVYEQVQVVRLASPDPAAGEAAPSLCFLDWVMQGRAARGEDWSLARYAGRNEVWLEGAQGGKDRLLVRDAVLLADPGLSLDEDGAPLKDTMHGLAVFGTLMLRGPLVDELGRFFLSEFAALPRLGARDFHDGGDTAPSTLTEPPASAPSLEAWRAARLRREQADGVLWSAAAVRGCVVVKFGARAGAEGARLWLGAMLAREGSVAAAFGEEALMCVK